ncbi:MAG: phospho-sugar mutase [Actinomycetota bacterium]|nr:phospho-sugar mutase [Actinomycetota bacterium]
MSPKTDQYGLESQLKRWIAHDPDPVTREHLVNLLNSADARAIENLFNSRIQFGTAGLRGRLGPGPNRMNQLTVRQLATGLASYLGAGSKVVLGRDARHKSEDFLDDIAAVLTAKDIDVIVFPEVIPTPLLAFSVRHLKTDMGIMVTASHNPSSDNGCKVYMRDGAQLRAPIDEEIDKLIRESEFPSINLPQGNGTLVNADRGLEEAYCAAITKSLTQQNTKTRIAYTPLHGVAMRLIQKSFTKAQAGELMPVKTQMVPDADFPTVSFPNPEEHGVMDSVIDLAKASNADLALANDPDGDRLAVAIPTLSGDWRLLSGDEIGALLFNHVARKTSGNNRKVVTTIVCSKLVSKIASNHGVEHATTLTGFKWIIPAAYNDSSLQPIFCYEEALGYATNTAVRDKDGISAALMMAELTAALKEQGQTLEDELDALSLEYGHHVTKTWRVRFNSDKSSNVIPRVMQHLRANPLSTVNQMKVLTVKDYLLQDNETALPSTDLIVIKIENNVRISIRPSGTEPMIKLYMEIVVPVTGREELPEASRRAKILLENLGVSLENQFIGIMEAS